MRAPAVAGRAPAVEGRALAAPALFGELLATLPRLLQHLLDQDEDTDAVTN